ncbi:unnamed protein product, partial [Durusdinium trenchii]
ALLGQLKRDHPLQAKLKAEFATDFSEVQAVLEPDEPPLPPPEEGPPGEEITTPPLETQVQTQEEADISQAQRDLERTLTMNEDPFKLEPTPEENNQALFEAGVRQYDDDLNLDVPEDEQDLWGAPKGFAELSSINDEAVSARFGRGAKNTRPS